MHIRDNNINATIRFVEISDKDSFTIDTYLYDLLKWTLKKGFYQQTLTIFESKIPNEIVERGIYYYAKNENDVDDFL